MKRFDPNLCPEPGDGVHSWFLHAAHCAVTARLSDEEAIEEITLLATREPRWNEIEDALSTARRKSCGSAPTWSRPNPGLIDRVTKGCPTLVDLIARSPRSSGRIEVSEQMMFAFFPELPRSVRAITSAERGAGCDDGYDAVLVTKESGRIEVSEQMHVRLLPGAPAVHSRNYVCRRRSGIRRGLELASRWRCSTETIKRRQRSGLLHPLRLSQRSLLYKIEKIEAREGGTMSASSSGSGEVPSAKTSPIRAEEIPQSNKIRVSRGTTANKHTENCDDAREIIEQIRTDQILRRQIGSLRVLFNESMASTNGDRKVAKDAVTARKLRLPGVLFSGTFHQRNDKALSQHSGLLCADLDGLGPEKIAEARARLRDSMHLWADFVSPTGDGLKAVFRVRADGETHKASFRAVEQHVHQLTGLRIDKSCSNVGRLCFLSFDPDSYLKEEAVELPPLVETENPRKDTGAPPVADDLLESRRGIAVDLLDEIDWESDSSGYCTCPGQDLHTGGDGNQDCIVYLDQIPTIKCFHESCRATIEAFNRELRSRIGKAEFPGKTSGNNGATGLMPSAWFNQKFPALSERFGHAVLLGKPFKGPLFVKDIAEDFLAATLSAEGSPDTPTVFVTSEQKFYTYCPEEGIYIHQRPPALLARLSLLLLECGRQAEDLLDTANLKFRLRETKKLMGVLKKAEHLLGVSDDFFSADLTEFIACSNGMLRLNDKKLLPFSPEYHRRNKLAVAFDPKGTCSLFLDTLMRPALDPDDLDLVQRSSGLALLGVNLAQRIVILDGTAGGGKGTSVRVLVGIIGNQNVGTLRTRHLGDRFEVGRFLGKTLLYGADVPEKFLNQQGAQVLKSLTGGDPVALEFKRSNETPLIECNFNVLVTCNSRLTVHLEGDTEAWRRRLVIVKYTKPAPKQVIASLSQEILDTEGSGVLNWYLEGLDKARGTVGN